MIHRTLDAKIAVGSVFTGVTGVYLGAILEVASALTVFLGLCSVAVGLYIGVMRARKLTGSQKGSPAMIAALLPIFSTVIDRLIPDSAEAARVKSEIESQVATAEIELAKAQIELSKEDAKSGKGGFRWGAGWLCIVSLGYAWLLHPMLTWALISAGSGVEPPPVIDPSAQYAMLTGMLGLAGVRSFDLLKGSRK